ncbi:hypothetical protein BASA50_001721 [Batrachochytrium salamandrivorans]|uniref:Uncharacterized protein n=1 Tax=Batrachochytrium salamandrivorans TaxID=1357716 RepID=A0ABQ8FN94_9FUNG|nr:hypothetical protein BASA50_001721 [Batrachochytrium salamandrivorans]KAH9268614.1 hypothetical protein BASA83_009246 [Batrachochytrium salamandrivorans]
MFDSFVSQKHSHHHPYNTPRYSGSSSSIHPRQGEARPGHPTVSISPNQGMAMASILKVRLRLALFKVRQGWSHQPLSAVIKALQAVKTTVVCHRLCCAPREGMRSCQANLSGLTVSSKPPCASHGDYSILPSHTAQAHYGMPVHISAEVPRNTTGLTGVYEQSRDRSSLHSLSHRWGRPEDDVYEHSNTHNHATGVSSDSLRLWSASSLHPSESISQSVHMGRLGPVTQPLLPNTNQNAGSTPSYQQRHLYSASVTDITTKRQPNYSERENELHQERHQRYSREQRQGQYPEQHQTSPSSSHSLPMASLGRVLVQPKWRMAPHMHKSKKCLNNSSRCNRSVDTEPFSKPTDMWTDASQTTLFHSSLHPPTSHGSQKGKVHVSSSPSEQLNYCQSEAKVASALGASALHRGKIRAEIISPYTTDEVHHVATRKAAECRYPTQEQSLALPGCHQMEEGTLSRRMSFNGSNCSQPSAANEYQVEQSMSPYARISVSSGDTSISSSTQLTQSSGSVHFPSPSALSSHSHLPNMYMLCSGASTPILASDTPDLSAKSSQHDIQSAQLLLELCQSAENED